MVLDRVPKRRWSASIHLPLQMSRVLRPSVMVGLPCRMKAYAQFARVSWLLLTSAFCGPCGVLVVLLLRSLLPWCLLLSSMMRGVVAGPSRLMLDEPIMTARCSPGGGKACQRGCSSPLVVCGPWSPETSRDGLKHLVAQALARHSLPTAFQEACLQYLFGLITRAAPKAFASSSTPPATALDPRAAVPSADAVAAFDHVSRQAMLEGLPGGGSTRELKPLLPFGGQLCGSSGLYTWRDADGHEHGIAQGKGGRTSGLVLSTARCCRRCCHAPLSRQPFGAMRASAWMLGRHASGMRQAGNRLALTTSRDPVFRRVPSSRLAVAHAPAGHHCWLCPVVRRQCKASWPPSCRNSRTNPCPSWRGGLSTCPFVLAGSSCGRPSRPRQQPYCAPPFHPCSRRELGAGPVGQPFRRPGASRGSRACGGLRPRSSMHADQATRADQEFGDHSGRR